MEAHGYVRRVRGKEDRRQVLVSLQARGARLLERVVEKRIIELRANGRELVAAIGALLEGREAVLKARNGRQRPTAENS